MNETDKNDISPKSTSTDSQHDNPPKRQRKRPSFVCTNCKRRKIRCDRRSPCSNCLKSNPETKCTYDSPTLKRLFTDRPNYKLINGTSSFSIKENYDDTPNLIELQQQNKLSLNNNLKEQLESNELQDEMSRLKSQISNLETLLLQSNSHQIRPLVKTTSLLDLKLPSLNRCFLLKKSSRVSIRGSLSLSVPQMHSSLSMVLRKFINTERDAWKRIHGSIPTLPKLLNCDPGIDDIVSQIETYVVPNYQAILERLLYFKDHLNDLLYNGLIDMKYVAEYAKLFFEKVSPNKWRFLKPLKEYSYSRLSLIFALVESTSLFAKHDSNNQFNYYLDETSLKIIVDLSRTTLAISNYQRKQSYAALYSLIILRDNFYTYSITGADSMDETKSGYINTTTIIYSFQLCLHRDPSSLNEVALNKTLDPIYTMPVSNHKITWCHLKMLDATYSVNLGTPLLINDSFSDTAAPAIIGNNILVMFTNLQREAATLINSVEPCSLNDLINLYEKYRNFNHSLGTFKDLLSPNNPDNSNSYLDLIAQKISIKMKTFRVIGLLMGFLRSLLSNNSLYPTDQINFKNLTMLKEEAAFYETEFSKFVLITGSLVVELANGEKTVFRDQFKKYLVYFRTDLLRLLYPSFLLFAIAVSCTYLTVESLNAKSDHLAGEFPFFNINTNSIELFSLSNTNYRNIELAMAGRYNSETVNKEVDEHVKTFLSNPKQIVKYYLEIHASLSSSPIFFENYGYFTLMKIISVFSCFVDSLIKINEAQSTPGSNARSSTDPEHDMSKVWEKTKLKILKTMKVGYVDMGFNLDDNKESLETWFNSFFDSDDGVIPFYDIDVAGRTPFNPPISRSNLFSPFSGSGTLSGFDNFQFQTPQPDGNNPSTGGSNLQTHTIHLEEFNDMMPVQNIISQSPDTETNQYSSSGRKDDGLQYDQTHSADPHTQSLLNGFENHLATEVDVDFDARSKLSKDPIGGSYQMFF